MSHDKEVRMGQQISHSKQRKVASMHFDGATYPLNPGHGGAGAVLTLEDGEVVSRSKYLGPQITNNQAEYHGLLLGLATAEEHEVTILRVYGDSQLVIRQVNGEYECRNPALIDLCATAKRQTRQFRLCELHWIPREENSLADAAASEALRSFGTKPAPDLSGDFPLCSPRPDIADLVGSLNQAGSGARFRDWLSLKSGADTFSRLRGSKLTEQVPQEVREALSSAFTDEERKTLLDKAFRWWLRGLSVPCAVRKVRVDEDASRRFRK